MESYERLKAQKDAILAEERAPLIALQEAARKALAFYDGLVRPHDDGEQAILDELQRALSAAPAVAAPREPSGVTLADAVKALEDEAESREKATVYDEYVVTKIKDAAFYLSLARHHLGSYFLITAPAPAPIASAVADAERKVIEAAKKTVGLFACSPKEMRAIGDLELAVAALARLTPDKADGGTV